MPAKTKKKRKLDLPPYIVLKNKTEWHAKLSFKTTQRDSKGRLIYEQMTRKVEPQTAERAAEVVDELRRQHQQASTLASPENRTLAEFIDAYFISKARSVTARTMKDYRQMLNRYIRGSKLGAMPLTEIRAIDVQTFYDHHLTAGMSAAMLRKIHAVLRMAFRRAVVWEETSKSPAEHVMLPRIGRRQSPAFEPNQARRFVKACESDPQFFVLEFALETGARPQEYLALTWADIDFKKRTVHINKALSDNLPGGGFEIKETKTPGSKRTITMSEHLTARLREHKDRQDATIVELEREMAKPLMSQKKIRGFNYRKRGKRKMSIKAILEAYRKYDLVFPASNGMPKAINNLNRREMKDVMTVAKLNIPEFTVRNLRHSSATLLIASGANIKYVSRRLGHSSVNVTLTHYAGLLPEMDREAHEIMAGILRPN